MGGTDGLSGGFTWLHMRAAATMPRMHPGPHDRAVRSAALSSHGVYGVSPRAIALRVGKEHPVPIVEGDADVLLFNTTQLAQLLLQLRDVIGLLEWVRKGLVKQHQLVLVNN